MFDHSITHLLNTLRLRILFLLNYLKMVLCLMMNWDAKDLLKRISVWGGGGGMLNFGTYSLNRGMDLMI